MEEVLREMRELTELLRQRSAELDRRLEWDKEISREINSMLRDNNSSINNQKPSSKEGREV